LIFPSFHKQYNIKKKEEIVEQLPQEEPNPLMRKKKTPEELAAEAEQEDLDDFTSKYLKKCRIDAFVALISGLTNSSKPIPLSYKSPFN
jgi:Synaphin protein